MKRTIILVFCLQLMLSCNESNFDASTVPLIFNDELTEYDISKQVMMTPIRLSELSEMAIHGDDLKTSILERANYQSMTGPIQIGLVYIALNNMIENIEATMGKVTGDIHSQLTNLLSTANILATQWNKQFQNNLNKTFEDLNRTETRIVEDTEALIRLMQQVIRQIEKGTIDVARLTTGDADILAYNITSMFSRKKIPRFVYQVPSHFRIGSNEPIIQIRGNFLGFKPYDFEISESNERLIPLGFSANQVTLKIPKGYLDSIMSETTISLSAQPFSRKKRLLWWGHNFKKTEIQSQIVNIKPKITYSISVTIEPWVKLPTSHTFTYHFYDSDENCKADRRVDRLFPLPAGWEIGDIRQVPDVEITTGSCGSDLVGSRATYSGNNAVHVEARIKGCGTNVLGFNCKGRGWLGYVLRIPAKSYEYRPIEKFEKSFMVDDQRNFHFEYPKINIPLDNKGTKFSYLITINIEEGNRERKIEISDINPNAEGIRTRMIDNQLSLEIIDEI